MTTTESYRSIFLAFPCRLRSAVKVAGEWPRTFRAALPVYYFTGGFNLMASHIPYKEHNKRRRLNGGAIFVQADWFVLIPLGPSVPLRLTPKGGKGKLEANIIH